VYNRVIGKQQTICHAYVTVADDIENVGVKAPNVGQLRYFSAEDETAANSLAGVLNSDGKQQFVVEKTRVLNPPRNVIELWLPKP
jgi:hypothetical protein